MRQVKKGKSAGAAENRGKLREAAQALLSSSLSGERQEEIQELKNRGIRKPTEADALMLGMLHRAEKGEMDALKFLRDLTGETKAENRKEFRKTQAPGGECPDFSALTDSELLAMTEDG